MQRTLCHMISIVVDLEIIAYLGFSFHGHSHEQNDTTRGQETNPLKISKLNDIYTYRGGNWYAYFTSPPCDLARFDLPI